MDEQAEPKWSRSVLGSVEEVTPDWLTEVLRRQDTLAGIRVAEVTVGESPPALFSRVAKLGLAYAGAAPPQAPTRLFLKMTKPGGTPATWAMGRGEIGFYRVGAPAIVDPPVPRCYDAVFDEPSERFHLLIEDLSESHRELDVEPVPPTVAESEGVIDALARMHAPMWDHPGLGKGMGPGLPDLDKYIRGLDKLFADFADTLGDRLSPERRRRCERMIAARPLLKERFSSAKDMTLIHGDMYVGNQLHPRDGSADGVRLIDWEWWRQRPAAWDLAHMMAVSWHQDRRRALEDRLLQHYHRAIEAQGVRGYGLDALRRDYRLALIDHLLIPLGQRAWKLPPYMWCGSFESIMLAYEDLGLEEFLDAA